MCASASAVTAYPQTDGTNTIPGIVANSIIADGQGADWTGIVIRADLWTGSIYNGAPDSNLPQSAFWGVPGFNILEWDTWVGVPGDGTNGIAGGAGDLGGGPLSMTGQTLSVTAFNTTTTDTGPVRVANLSFSSDANGTFAAIVSFSDGQLYQWSQLVSDGVLWPEPGALALLGIGSLGLLKRG
jgi:hypothetical protein